MKKIKFIIILAVLLLFDMAVQDFSQARIYTRDDVAKTYTKEDVTRGWEIHRQNIGDDKGWKLKRDKDGIKVYIRKVPLSPINSFKGIVEMETDLSTLVTFMADPRNYISYLQMCNSVDILKHVSETDKILYAVNRPPWPVNARDSISLTNWTQDPETLIVTGKSISLPDYTPHREKFIRCPLLLINFKLRPLENGNTEFTFESIVEVGGWVPNWVINFCVVDTPFTSIKRIQKQMPFDEKYKKQENKWLKLPLSHQKIRETILRNLATN